MDGFKTGKLGGALGGVGQLLPFFKLYLPSCTKKKHFIFLFFSFSKTFLNFLFIATTYERSNVRLKGGFARTSRWVVNINKFTDWAHNDKHWIQNGWGLDHFGGHHHMSLERTYDNWEGRPIRLFTCQSFFSTSMKWTQLINMNSTMGKTKI